MFPVVIVIQLVQTSLRYLQECVKKRQKVAPRDKVSLAMKKCIDLESVAQLNCLIGAYA
jgi:hypothetical protein